MSSIVNWLLIVLRLLQVMFDGLVEQVILKMSVDEVSSGLRFFR